MRNVKKHFEECIVKYPAKSTYICFAESVDNVRISKFDMKKAFNRLVDKEDYFKDEKEAVLDFFASQLIREN